MSRKALGRGLKALIPESDSASGLPRKVPIDQIDPNPKQPRKNFDADAIDELASSIREHGVLEPVIVRPLAGRYELVVGERRWRAARLAGLTEIPAIVRTLSDVEALELALIENIQREDLSPLEEAETYRRLMDEFHMTQEQVAKRVGKSRSTVANSLRLLDLDPELRDEIQRGALTAGHAKALLSVTSKAERLSLAQKVIDEGLSVRAIETLVAQKRETTKPKSRATGGAGRDMSRRSDPFIADLTDRLQQSLGTKVRLVTQGQRGRIEIDYYSRDELERIVELLGGPLD